MLEELRHDMIVAFKIYAQAKPGSRESEWLHYTKCRENFLAEDARIKNREYSPLKIIALGSEH